MPKTNTMTTMF